VKRAGVLGLGNVLLGDDGAGPYLVRSLLASHSFPPEVTVSDAGTPGFDLVPLIADFDALIVADTVAAPGNPGEVKTYALREILNKPLATRWNPHEPVLREALLLARLHGLGPRRVLLVGVVPDRMNLGIGLSPSVRAALPRMKEEILKELRFLGFESRIRSPAVEPAIWWERGEVGSGA